MIQNLKIQQNATQQSNQVHSQTRLQSNITQIPVDTGRLPPNINQLQKSSAVEHPSQNDKANFGFNNTNLDSDS